MTDCSLIIYWNAHKHKIWAQKVSLVCEAGMLGKWGILFYLYNCILKSLLLAFSASFFLLLVDICVESSTLFRFDAQGRSREKLSSTIYSSQKILVLRKTPTLLWSDIVWQSESQPNCLVLFFCVCHINEIWENFVYEIISDVVLPWYVTVN